MSSPVNVHPANGDDSTLGFRELFDETRDSVLASSVAALTGKSPECEPEAQTQAPEPRKEEQKKPTTWATDSDSDSSDDEEYFPLDAGSELTRTVTQCVSDQAATGASVREMRQQLDKLSNLVDHQSKIIFSLEGRAKLQAEQISQMRSGFESQLAEFERGIKARLDDALRMHKETPELVDRLVQSTNAVLSYLPEDTRQTLSKVELSPQESAVVNQVRVATTRPRMKIPKHAR